MTRTGIACLLHVILTLSGMTIWSQDNSKSGENEQWLHYYLQAKAGDRSSLQADAGFRWSDGFSARRQYIVRVAYTYQTSPAVGLGAGFAHVGSYSATGLSQVEFRPYQEASLRSAIGALGFGHRFRLEERFLKPANMEGPDRFIWRLRYAISTEIPIFSPAGEYAERKITLHAGNEFFLNAGKALTQHFFGQNRLFTGPSLKWSENLTITLLWVGQLAATSRAGDYQFTNIVWLQCKQKVGYRPNQRRYEGP